MGFFEDGNLKRKRWLLIVSIFGILFSLFTPYMFKWKKNSREDYKNGNIKVIFINGYLLVHYFRDDIQLKSFNLRQWSEGKPTNACLIIVVIGNLLIFLAGILQIRKQQLFNKYGSKVVCLGGFLGFLGTMLFLQFYDWVDQFPGHIIYYEFEFYLPNMHRFGFYIRLFYFLIMFLWGIIYRNKDLTPPCKNSESRMRLFDLAHVRGNHKANVSTKAISLKGFLRLFDLQSISEVDKVRTIISSDIQFQFNDSEVSFIRNNLIIDPSSIIRQFKKYSCFHCGAPIKSYDKQCIICHYLVISCSICKLPINKSDLTGCCPKCDSISHYPHLEAWLRTNGKCPSCLQVFLPNEIKTKE
jgi:hypothetical protein